MDASTFVALANQLVDRAEAADRAADAALPAVALVVDTETGEGTFYGPFNGFSEASAAVDAFLDRLNEGVPPGEPRWDGTVKPLHPRLP